MFNKKKKLLGPDNIWIDKDYKYILPFYIDAIFKSQSITEKICAHSSQNIYKLLKVNNCFFEMANDLSKA